MENWKDGSGCAVVVPLFTVIESCRRLLDPLAYLRDVLTRLANMTNRQIPDVLPAAWAKTQQKIQRAVIAVVA
jgi:hypothetical protein